MNDIGTLMPGDTGHARCALHPFYALTHKGVEQLPFDKGRRPSCNGSSTVS